MTTLYTAAYIVLDREGNADMAPDIHTSETLEEIMDRATTYALLLPRSFYKAMIYHGNTLIGKYQRYDLLNEKGQALTTVARPDLKLRMQN